MQLEEKEAKGIKQGIQTLHWINTKKQKRDNKPKGDNYFLLLGDMCRTLPADTILELQVFHISTVKGIFTCDVLLHLQPWSKFNYVAIWISPFAAFQEEIVIYASTTIMLHHNTP